MTYDASAYFWRDYSDTPINFAEDWYYGTKGTAPDWINSVASEADQPVWAREACAYINPLLHPDIPVIERRNGAMALICDCSRDPVLSGGLPYTGALCSTVFSSTFGFWEVEASMTQTGGFMGAMFLNATNTGDQSEADINENIQNYVMQTLHGPDIVGSETVGYYVPSVQSWHKYAIDIQDDYTVVYFDGSETRRWRTPNSLKVPMQLVLQCNVGGPGSWLGEVAPSGVQPPWCLLIKTIGCWPSKAAHDSSKRVS